MKRSAAFLLVLTLTACSGWAPIGGRQACGQPVGYSINTAGFTSAQIADIKQAAVNTKTASGVDFTNLGDTTYTDEDYPNSRPDIILISHRAADNHPAESLPFNVSGTFHGGWMHFDSTVPAGIALSDPNTQWQATYLKVAMHEWGHLVGLNDVPDQDELMGNINRPGYGPGDVAGMHALGCF